jgi:hypothetical protein
MKQLKDIATVIRSKNSGPYELTFDVIFNDKGTYEKFCQAHIFTKATIARLYNISEDQVISVLEFHPAMALKATIVRPWSSGAIGERDVYGAQQHGPLMELPISEWD